MSSSYDQRVAQVFSTMSDEFVRLIEAEGKLRTELRQRCAEAGYDSAAYRDGRQEIAASHGRSEGLNAAWEVVRRAMFQSLP